jgi:hypothetical protein
MENFEPGLSIQLAINGLYQGLADWFKIQNEKNPFFIFSFKCFRKAFYALLEDGGASLSSEERHGLTSILAVIIKDAGKVDDNHTDETIERIEILCRRN